MATSRFQLEEFTRVLSYDKIRTRISAEQAADVLEHLHALTVVVSDLPHLTISSDPADNVILATAISSRADGLVSGDKTDVLAFQQVQGIPIMTARHALEFLERSASP